MWVHCHLVPGGHGHVEPGGYGHVILWGGGGLSSICRALSCITWEVCSFSD
jgi:hypothetical protein